MKLLVYSYFPVLNNLQFGGAQLIMRDLLVGFVKAGVDVTVICPESDEADPLTLGNHFRILPVLKDIKNRPLFPYERLHNWQHIKRCAEQTDVIWTLDRAFPLEVSQPVVLTLDQFSYRDEMESLLSLTWDALIVSSRYLGHIVNSIVGPEFWEGEPPEIKVIPNGTDTDLFSPVDPRYLYSRLGLHESASYLLFPHRPDPNKGFEIGRAHV